MKLTHALVGLAALGGLALSAGAASAMPIGLATNTDIASNVEQAAYVCNRWGRCWWRPNYYYGGYRAYGPRYFGGGGYHRGWGYRRW